MPEGMQDNVRLCLHFKAWTRTRRPSAASPFCIDTSVAAAASIASLAFVTPWPELLHVATSAA